MINPTLRLPVLIRVRTVDLCENRITIIMMLHGPGARDDFLGNFLLFIFLLFFFFHHHRDGTGSISTSIRPRLISRYNTNTQTHTHINTYTRTHIHGRQVANGPTEGVRRVLLGDLLRACCSGRPVARRSVVTCYASLSRPRSYAKKNRFSCCK